MGRLTLAILLAATVPAPAAAQLEVVDDIGSLRGIDGVEVVIERPPAEAAWEGLTIEHLREEVSRRLGEVAIRVLPETGAPQPWLYVKVQVRQGRDALKDAYALSVSLELRQAVRLNRDQHLLGIATTWQTAGRLRVVTRDELSRTAVVLADALDEFIEAYRTENPAQ